MLRLFSLLLGFLGVLLPVNLQGRTSGVLLWGPKIVALAIAPWLALAGLITGIVGLRRRDPVIAGAGLTAAALAGRYTARVIQPPRGFDDAFGAGWQSRFPPAVEQRMLPRRWTPLLFDQGARVTRNLIFTTKGSVDRPLRADLWQPPGDVQPSGLGVIYVHGGAWRIGAKNMFTGPTFTRLARQGHLVMDVEYTLAPDTDISGMIRDVKRAILWLKKNGAIYGVDPARIVLMGGSAGAHLALMAAYSPNDPEFQPDASKDDTAVFGVVSYYGPSDLAAVQADVEVVGQRLMRRKRFWPYGLVVESLLRVVGLIPAGLDIEDVEYYMTDLVGVDLTSDPARYRRLSPVERVGPHCPPTLLLQGEMDIFGLAPATRRLHAALLRAGVLSVLVEFPQTDHAFDLVLPWISPSAQSAIYDLERFLALLLVDSPTISHPFFQPLNEQNGNEKHTQLERSD